MKNSLIVLVVEDNDLERQITAEILREEGFAVEEAPAASALWSADAGLV